MTMAFDRMRIFSRLPIRVHCWGGFGSQIFACVIAKRLASLFPARKIVLIFHSSGVTRRTLEIPKGFTGDFTVLTQDDFRTSNAEENSIDPKFFWPVCMKYADITPKFYSPLRKLVG